MPEKSDSNKTSPGRVDIIKAVKTPLGFFTLAILIVEAILGTTAGFSQGGPRMFIIISMVVLIFLLVIIVAIFAFLKPEALRGKRPAVQVSPELGLVDKTLSPTERITIYQELIKKETRNSLLLNFNVPNGYKAEISTLDKFPFGFCYPKGWKFIRMPQNMLYGTTLDKESIKRIGYARNFNVMIEDISGVKADLNEAYETFVNSLSSAWNNSKLVFKDRDSIFQGLRAMRSRIDWTQKRDKELLNVTAYVILVADKDQKNLYALIFTTTKDDFENSKPLFENIANTFRI